MKLLQIKYNIVKEYKEKSNDLEKLIEGFFCDGVGHSSIEIQLSTWTIEINMEMLPEESNIQINMVNNHNEDLDVYYEWSSYKGYDKSVRDVFYYELPDGVMSEMKSRGIIIG